MATRQEKGHITLRGRFSPGVRVRLVKVAGAHVLRPGETDEVVDTATVDEDGCVSFSKGVEVNERYFVSGIQQGEPLNVRARGRAEDDLGPLEVDGIRPERLKLADGSFVDSPPEQHQKPEVPEGATWLGQHQVPKGVIQRSDTPRGSAAPISAEELERAYRGHRKQEPTEPIVEAVEASEEPSEAPARTSVPKDRSATATAQKSTTAKDKE